MDITELESQPLPTIPEELYDIEPGQVVFFVPKRGIRRTSFLCIFTFFRYLEALQREDDVDLIIVHTDNDLLINTVAGRNPQETGIPYKVVTNSGDFTGFLSLFLGEDIEDFEKELERTAGEQVEKTDCSVIVEIDPRNRPVKKSADISGESFGSFGMEWLKKRPETAKEKAEKVQQNEDKIRKILWECAYLGIDIDLKGLAEAVEASNSKAESYELSLKMEPAKAGMIDCTIYVGENLELKLTPIQKAIYLTFLSLKDGLVIEEAKPDFTKRIQNIYRLLPNRSEKDDGILHVTYIQPQTLRGVISEVNATIARLIPGGVGLEFAIEGEKNNPYKVMRSTPEIRKQIITNFKL